MELDHISFNVKDISRAVEWYRENLSAHVLYQDESWGLVKVGNSKIAFTLFNHHPPHIAVRINSYHDFPAGYDICEHRDGSRYVYQQDNDGNTIEWIYYPPNLSSNL